MTFLGIFFSKSSSYPDSTSTTGFDSTKGAIASPKSDKLECKIGSQLRRVLDSLCLFSTDCVCLNAAIG